MTPTPLQTFVVLFSGLAPNAQLSNCKAPLAAWDYQGIQQGLQHKPFAKSALLSISSWLCHY
jgi:hypothetical protein